MSDNKKKKIMKYSKEVLTEYILQHMFLDFKKLDLIKSELELNNVYELQEKQILLNKQFKQLANEINKETDTKKLNDIIKKMKRIKTETEKNEKKIRKILFDS